MTRAEEPLVAPFIFHETPEMGANPGKGDKSLVGVVDDHHRHTLEDDVPGISCRYIAFMHNELFCFSCFGGERREEFQKGIGKGK
jgi:hypothetical protein